MCDFLDSAIGVRLSVAEYREDIARRRATIGAHACWRLERRQQVRRPQDVSWQAFTRGDWENALRLLRSRQDQQALAYWGDVSRGRDFFLVRVVDEPLTPDLRWRLHQLRLRSICGEQIRIVHPDRLRHLEHDSPLPDAVSVGKELLYQLLYTQDGTPAGAIRFEDPTAVARYLAAVCPLHYLGEDAAEYVERRVAPLPVPAENLGHRGRLPREAQLRRQLTDAVPSCRREER